MAPLLLEFAVILNGELPKFLLMLARVRVGTIGLTVNVAVLVALVNPP